MGSNGIGNAQERVTEKRASWFVRTNSGKLLWPGQKYILIQVFFDAMGRPPITSLSWDRIYTPQEYLFYLIKKDS